MLRLMDILLEIHSSMRTRDIYLRTRPLVMMDMNAWSACASRGVSELVLGHVCWHVVVAQDGAANGCFRDSRMTELCGFTGRRGRQREPCSGGWGGFPSLQTLALDKRDKGAGSSCTSDNNEGKLQLRGRLHCCTNRTAAVCRNDATR
jgi:hypothetical protein